MVHHPGDFSCCDRGGENPERNGLPRSERTPLRHLPRGHSLFLPSPVSFAVLVSGALVSAPLSRGEVPPPRASHLLSDPEQSRRHPLQRLGRPADLPPGKPNRCVHRRRAVPTESQSDDALSRRAGREPILVSGRLRQPHRAAVSPSPSCVLVRRTARRERTALHRGRVDPLARNRAASAIAAVAAGKYANAPPSRRLQGGRPPLD